jgi:hypothetical protein
MESRVVVYCHDAGMMRAIRAAIKTVMRFNAMANDFAAAVLAFRGQRVNRAFKTVKIVRDAVLDDLHRFVIIVFADFALHKS